MLAHLVLAVAVVFAVNLMPAFGPPTWAVLVFFRFRYVGAASAAHDSLSHRFEGGLFSPEAIITQLIGVAVLIAIVFIDWPAVIDTARAWWAARWAVRPHHRSGIARCRS